MQPHGGTASPHSSEASNCRSLTPHWDWRANRSPFLMAPRGHRIGPFGTGFLGFSFARQSERWGGVGWGGGGACVRYAGTVEISSSSLGSWLCCDLSLMVFGSNLLAQLTGNKGSPSPSPKVWMDSGFSWERFKKKKKKNPAEPSGGRSAHQEDCKRSSCLQTQTNSRALQFHSPVSFHISHLSDLCRLTESSGYIPQVPALFYSI